MYHDPRLDFFDQIDRSGVAVLRRMPSGWLARLAQAMDQALARLDYAPDLAEDIGSGRWLRGLGVMLAAGAMSLAFWPSLGPVPAAPPAHIDAAAAYQFTTQRIAALAAPTRVIPRIGLSADVNPVAFAPERPSLNLVATWTGADSLAAMLARAGVGMGDAARLGELIGAVVKPADIAPGTRFDITLGRRDAQGLPRPLERLAFRARMDLDLAITRDGAGYALSRHQVVVDTTPLRIRGVVGPSLYRSARAAGAPMPAIQQYLQAIDAHFSLDEVAPGDTFDLIVAYKRAPGGQSEIGQLLYAGLERDGHPRTQLLRWGDQGQFFDAANAPTQTQSQGLIMPVAGAHITSGFGMRYHPILGYTRLHAGVDFGAAYGSPIMAVDDGVVTWAGVHGGHGNYVKLEHGGGIATGYGHMSRIAVGLGMRVHAGEVIGYVGSTGLSTGPHLHYEVFRDGRPIDPMSAQFTVRAAVDPHEFDHFKGELARLMRVQPGAALAALPDEGHVALR